MKFIEYKDLEEQHLIDKVKMFGWLSDMLTQIDPEIILEMHRDKIKRIKKYMKTQSD